MQFLFLIIANKMNHCRECGARIDDRFNWWQALRCSRCRAKKDQELAELIEKNHWIDAENDSLRYAYTTAENKSKHTEYQYHKIKIRYNLLRQRNSVLLNDNKRLERQNKKQQEWIERLFARIHELEKTIEEKDVILESKREEVKNLMNQLLDHNQKK